MKKKLYTTLFQNYQLSFFKNFSTKLALSAIGALIWLAGFFGVCRLLLCRFRWKTRLKDRLHTSHVNGLWPVWLLKYDEHTSTWKTLKNVFFLVGILAMAAGLPFVWIEFTIWEKIFVAHITLELENPWN